MLNTKKKAKADQPPESRFIVDFTRYDNNLHFDTIPESLELPITILIEQINSGEDEDGCLCQALRQLYYLQQDLISARRLKVKVKEFQEN